MALPGAVGSSVPPDRDGGKKILIAVRQDHQVEYAVHHQTRGLSCFVLTGRRIDHLRPVSRTDDQKYSQFPPWSSQLLQSEPVHQEWIIVLEPLTAKTSRLLDPFTW